MVRNTIMLAAILSLVAPAPAAASCPGSGGQAVCESIAESDLFLYLWLDFITIVLTASDTVLAFGAQPPGLPVHPINIVHHVTSGVTILAGALGQTEGSFSSLARATLVLGLTSEAFAVADTIAIAARSRKHRRIQRRIEAGR